MAHFWDECIHLAPGRAGATSPSVHGHGDTSWACPHPGGVVAAAHSRPVQLHSSFNYRPMSANPVKMTRTATVVEGLDLTVFTWELLHLEEHVKKVLCLRVKSFSLAPRPTAGRNVTFVDVRPRKVGTWPVACLPPHQKLFTGRQRTFLTCSLG